MADINPKRIAKILQDARDSKGVTQEWLSDASGVSIQTVKRAEGKGTIGPESLRALCSVLGMDAEEVLERASLRASSASPILFRRSDVPRTDRQVIEQLRRACILPCLAVSAVGLGFSVILLLMYDETPHPGMAEYMVSAVLVAMGSLFVGMISSDRVLSDNIDKSFFGATLQRNDVVRCMLTYSISLFLSFLSVAIFFGLILVGVGSGTAILLAIAWGIASMYLPPRLLMKKVYKRLECMRDDAIRRFCEEMPVIIERIRDVVIKPFPENRIEEVARLLGEAQLIADAVCRSDDVRPLELLAEDVARGISGRKALLDYITLAQQKCGPARLTGLLANDAEMLELDLLRRVNAFV